MSHCDSHLHLADCPDISGLLELAGRVGVRLWSNSTCVADARTNLELKQRFPERMEAFVGVHPSRSNEAVDPAVLESLVVRAAGVGEAGLDPKYSSTSAGGAQLRLFVKQLELAEKFEKPVQVHSRGAEMACLDCLDSFHPPAVLLHWFEGAELAERAAAKGYYVSFGPALLYSRKLARIAGSYPRELILTESDAPVSYSALGENLAGPLLIPSVVFFLSSLLGVDFEEMAERISENSRRYFEGKKT